MRTDAETREDFIKSSSLCSGLRNAITKSRYLSDFSVDRDSHLDGRYMYVRGGFLISKSFEPKPVVQYLKTGTEL
jgi:hypothetical protein